MGVADRVRQSTPTFSFLSASLALTPKRCSSSMMMRPKLFEDYILADDPVCPDNDIDCATCCDPLSVSRFLLGI